MTFFIITIISIFLPSSTLTSTSSPISPRTNLPSKLAILSIRKFFGQQISHNPLYIYHPSQHLSQHLNHYPSRHLNYPHHHIKHPHHYIKYLLPCHLIIIFHTILNIDFVIISLIITRSSAISVLNITAVPSYHASIIFQRYK